MANTMNGETYSDGNSEVTDNNNLGWTLSTLLFHNNLNFFKESSLYANFIILTYVVT